MEPAGRGLKRVRVEPAGINQGEGLGREPALALWRQNIGHVLGLTMPPGLPHRPPLAMRLWLSRRSAKSGGTSSSGRSSGKAMSIESLENIVRNRVRMFLRHTWLVTILGTIVLGGAIWAGIYYSTKATAIRIAAGPPGSSNAKIVQILTDLVAKNHDRLKLVLVATDSANAGVP